MSFLSAYVRVDKNFGDPNSIVAKFKDGTALQTYLSARRVAAGARRRAPVRTGKLRSSISTTRVAFGHHEVRVGARYGAYVEYGTRHQPAQPFLRPAIEAERRSFIHALAGLFG